MSCVSTAPTELSVPLAVYGQWLQAVLASRLRGVSLSIIPAWNTGVSGVRLLYNLWPLTLPIYREKTPEIQCSFGQAFRLTWWHPPTHTHPTDCLPYAHVHTYTRTRQYLLAIQSICYGRSLFVPAFAFACGLRYLGTEYLWCVDFVVIESRGCTSRVASPNRTHVLCCCSRWGWRWGGGGGGLV